MTLFGGKGGQNNYSGVFLPELTPWILFVLGIKAAFIIFIEHLDVFCSNDVSKIEQFDGGHSGK